MQKAIKIKTKDNKIIFGTLDKKTESKKTLLIFVHGFTGNQNEHHYFNAVPFFTRKGFTTFRFNFYDKDQRSRQMPESSISTHVNDLETVYNHFTKKYKEIILVGHSLGASIILLSQMPGVSKIILWDPTSGFKNIQEKDAYFNQKLDKYIFNWGKAIIVGKSLVDEWQKLDIGTLVKNINVPCKFIFAEKAYKYKSWKPFLKKIKTPYDSVVIKKASHTFVEEGVEEKLFSETLKWIQ